MLGQSIILATLFLDKPPGGRLPVLIIFPTKALNGGQHMPQASV